MARKLSKKECVAVLHIFMAMICIAIVALLYYEVPFPQDYFIFYYQICMNTTAFVFLLFGCSTWCYNSNVSRTRYQVRIFCVLVLWVLLILDAVTCSYCFINYCTGDVYTAYEKDFSTKLQYTIICVSIYMGLAMSLVMFFINLILTVIICKKRRRRKRSRRRNKRS
ncbi:uncharacterized protein LOC119671237 [Teleopsis dalmanni]|uniref:uncharacterized protein LOC119671237 n=1 Tax=Teleopsis dalmanni TaxID=139649 RepID=UPI0018CE9796|nr:uncharacterized protein LOC119671237 [Teleopsis dalmanni]